MMKRKIITPIEISWRRFKFLSLMKLMIWKSILSRRRSLIKISTHMIMKMKIKFLWKHWSLKAMPWNGWINHHGVCNFVCWKCVIILIVINDCGRIGEKFWKSKTKSCENLWIRVYNYLSVATFDLQLTLLKFHC